MTPKRVLFVVVWAVVLAALAAGVSAVFTLNYLLINNTLDTNGHWESTKQKREMFLMGAVSFMREPQALARFSLNLGAWHGFQEVLLRNKVHVQKLDFDFSLPNSSYLNFIINKGEEQFSGIRIAMDEKIDSLYFTARNDGEFLSKTKLKIDSPRPDTWHHFTLEVKEDSPEVHIDGQPVDVPGLAVPVPCQIGFRGCKKEVEVRNLFVFQPNVAAVSDNFFLTENKGKVFKWAWIGAVFGTVCLLLSLKMANVEWGRAVVSVSVFSVTAILVGAVIAWFLHYHYLDKYPLGLTLARAEATYLDNVQGVRMEEIQSEYSEACPPDVCRVLFVGTSQTYGSGAAKRADTFVSVLEKRLNEAGLGKKIQCINTAIVGQNASLLLEPYEKYWLKLNPKVVVIDLSNNDDFAGNAEKFEESLNRFVALNKERNIKTLFVLEANSPETQPKELTMHPVMRKVAEQNQVPLVDLHSYLRDNWERGFIWWDFVHLTSFGHRLAADCIFETLRGIVATL